jgi:hypothetical protein
MGMRWLKILLVVNGVASVSYVFSNILMPTSFFAPTDASGYGLDAVKLVGMGYLPLGIVQLGSWRIADRFAVRLIAVASMAYAAGFALLAAMAGSGSSDLFHQYGLVIAGAWALVAVLYAWLIYRERPVAA